MNFDYYYETIIIQQHVQNNCLRIEQLDCILDCVKARLWLVGFHEVKEGQSGNSDLC